MYEALKPDERDTIVPATSPGTFQGEDLARRRLQRKGSLYKEGNWWRLRWREDAISAAGEPIRTRPTAVIGPCRGPGALTQRQAERLAWETILSKLDTFTACPQSMMTLAQFVQQKFEPEVVWALKHAGKLHYAYCFGKILPELGSKRLRDITSAHISALTRQSVSAGLSIQTAKHFKNALSAVFRHAKGNGYYVGENPAAQVKMPTSDSRSPSAFSFEKGQQIIEALPSPIREMALFSMCASPNIAELCGLRWKRLNLTDQYSLESGEAIPPFSVAIRENFYKGKFGTVKTGARHRVLPVPAPLVSLLVALKAKTKFSEPDHPVFSSRAGTPIDTHNVTNRLFKKIGKALGIRMTWHALRHSCATYAEMIGMQRSDRIALLGHSRGKMTDLYTHSDVNRMRTGVDGIAEKLLQAGGMIQ